jgi:hypothetical protein
MNDVFMTLYFGKTPLSYSGAFVIFLIVGWATIILHARQCFDQPTYDLTQNEPTFIMVPRFFSSQHLYLRGFLIYLIGITGFYLALSLAGPAIVTGVLAVFNNPDITKHVELKSEDGLVPGQWPLVLALTIVGLAPNVAGLRTPELLLRRFSHRVALIPAYARYLAFQMQQSPFDSSQYRAFKYPAGLRYRPSVASELPIDKTWLRVCVIFARIRDLADGIVVPETGRPLDDTERAPIQKEVQVFDSRLRELDNKLSDPSLDDEERTVLEAQVNRLLLRAYLVASCAIIAFRVRDVTSEVKKLGFAQVGASPPAIIPVLMVFFLLFLVMVLTNSTLSTLLGQAADAVVPPGFALNCISTTYNVVIYAVASSIAIVLYRKLENRGAWHQGPIWARRFTSYFVVAFTAYLASWVLLSVLLFPILASQGLERLTAFSTFRSIPPAVGAVLVCLWLSNKSAGIVDFAKYSVLTALAIGATAGFASLLLSSPGDDPYAMMRIAFDAGQGVLSGLAVAFLSEISRASPLDPSFSAPTAARVAA